MVFSEGDYRPKMVKIPYAGIEKGMTREEILNLSENKTNKGESLYDINPVCLYCEKAQCETFDSIRTGLGDEIIDGWMSIMSEIRSKDEFEDICMDIILTLKRMEYFERCLISKMIGTMRLNIQEQHELYMVYRQIRK